MNILVFSDAHGCSDAMEQVLRMHRNADVALFLGDGIADFMALRTAFPNVMFSAVCGNCDPLPWSGLCPEEDVLTVEGKRILYMHGHRFGVKGGIGSAVAYAKQCGADALLYGHTHIAEERYASLGEKHLLVGNPGSIGYVTDGKRHFGLLTVQNGAMLFSIGSV